MSFGFAEAFNVVIFTVWLLVALFSALLAEVVGAVLVLIAGLLIGISTSDLTIGSEILGRTSPSLVDLLIAFVGGLAGGFTFVSTGLSSVVVGVAIATALVPPLTTCGILFARHWPTPAVVAFLLFLANFTAFALGAMIVFLLAGHHPAAADRAKKVFAPRLVCLALVLLLAFHLNGTLRHTSARSIMESNIRKSLAQEVAKIPGARLVDVVLVHETVRRPHGQWHARRILFPPSRSAASTILPATWQDAT